MYFIDLCKSTNKKKKIGQPCHLSYGSSTLKEDVSKLIKSPKGENYYKTYKI